MGADTAAQSTPTDLSTLPALDLGAALETTVDQRPDLGGLTAQGHEGWRSDTLLAQLDVSKLPAPGVGAQTGTAVPVAGAAAVSGATVSQVAGLIMAGGLAGIAAVAAKGKDATPPKVDTVSDGTPAQVSNQDVVFVVTFSEAIVGPVGIGSFAASNGTITAVSQVGNSNAYSVTVAPTPNTASAEISLRLVATGLRDAAGNWVLDADLAPLGRQGIDTLAPTLVISSDKALLSEQEVAQITFTFSEDPGASFAASDVVVTGGTLGPVTGSGLTRTATFTPTADLTGVSATLAVAAASYSDAVGNAGGAATTLSIALETRTPTSLVIQDGYLDGADVWVDMNDSGTIDADDYRVGRSVEGRVNGFLTAAQKAHSLIAQGGRDISTGLPFEGSYSATPGSTVVNPLTTLVQSIVKTELGDTSQLSPQEALERLAQAKASAMAKVSEALDLPLGVDLTRIDTIATASAAQDDAASGISLTQALEINSKALMVANVMAVGAAALKGAGNSSSADAPTLSSLSDFIVGGIVKAMDSALASGSALAMDDSAALTAILTSAAQTATDSDPTRFSMDEAKLSNASAAVGTAVASTNSLIDTLTGNAKSAVATNAQAAEDTLLRILAAQKAAMNQIEDIKTGDSAKLLNLANDFSDAGAVQLQSQSVGLLRLGTAVAVDAPAQAVADSAAPQVVSVSVKAERAGELAQFVVLMSEGVLIESTGTSRPTLAIQTTAGSAPSFALLDTSRSGGDRLVFIYRVAPGDTQLAVLDGSINLPQGSSIKDLAGNLARLDLTSGLSGFVAPPIDSIAPSITVSAREAFVPAGQSTLLTFSVSEAVAFSGRSNAVHADAFGADDITVREAGQVVRGRISQFTALGEREGRYLYQALLTPGDSNAATEVAVGAGRFTDNAGNPNLESNLVAVARQSLAPSIVVTSEQSSFNAKDAGNASVSTTLRFMLSQGSSNFTADDVTVSGPGSLSNFSGSGRQYSAVLTGMDSSTQVQVAAGRFSGEGPSNLASNTKGFSVDTRAPSVVSVSDGTAAAVTRQDITFKVDFDEAVSGAVNTNSFSASLASVLSVSRLPGSNSYTVVVRPAANAEGTVALSLRATGLADAAGNPVADASLASKGGQAIDTLAPALAITSDKAALKSGESATVTFAFSEAPSGFAASDVTTTGGTLSTPTASSLDPKVYTATFTPTANLASGSASITVAAVSYLDAAGNAGGAGTTPAISIDTVAPALAITSDKAAVKIGESATVTFAFSEAPSGFAASDVTTTGGTLSTPTASSLDPKVYTATFTPTANLASGSASITVAAGSYLDAAGNAGGAGTTPAISIDTVAPTVTSVTEATTAAITKDPISFTVSFSEALTGTLGTSSFTANNGTVTRVSQVGTSNAYTVVVTPTVGLASGTVALSLVGAGLSDAAGNALANASLTGLASQAIDTLAPNAPALVLDNGEVKVTAETGANTVVTFSRSDGGTLSKAAIGNGSTPVTVVLDAADLTALGKGTIGASAVATDSVGNASSVGTASFTFDSVAPAVSAVTKATTAAITKDPISFTVTFSEALTGTVGTSNFTATNGAVTSVGQVGTSNAYTVVVTPTAGVASGSVALSLVGAGLADAAGNAVDSASLANFASQSIDTLAPNAPALALSTGVGDGATDAEATGEVVTVTAESGTNTAVTFSRTGGGTVNKTIIGHGSTPVAVTLTSAELTTLGNGTISVSTIATDAAGNTSSAVSSSFTLDTAAPTLSSTAPTTALGAALAGTAGNSAGETITLTLTFDGNVNGLTAGSNSTIFTVAGSGVNATWAGTNGTNTRTLTYTIASGQNGQAAINETALKAALIADIKDAAGNAFAYSANSGDIPNIDSTALPVIDTSAPLTPTLTLGTGVANGASLAEATTALMTLTAESGASTAVTFSRTGGGTVNKTIIGHGSTPVAVTLTSAELTTLGNGTISVSTIATDAAGNTSSAVSSSFTLDTAAPTLSSTAPTTALGAAVAGTAGNSAGETITLTLTFDSSVNGLTSGSNNTIFTVAGSGVNASWAGTNGTNTRTLTYTVASSQNGQAAINEIALQAALGAGITDAAGNAFAGSTGIALSSVTSDIPNSSLGSITYDATSGKLNLGATGNTDMWSQRGAAIIAYVPSPQVALNETWSVETRLEINDRSQSGQNAGLTFYSQAGARPDFTFGLTGWNGNWRINVEDFSAGEWSGGVAVYSGSSVYLRASVTEKGASDEYQFFYKANSADAWTQLGSVNFVPVNPVQGNALTGIFYKTAAARPGVSVSELSTSGGSSANIPNIDSTALPVVDTQAPTTSIASAALSVDSGTSGNDFITNTASQTISGNLSANLAAGETVLVSLNNGANWLAASGSVGSNAWSLASQTLSGSNTLKVKVTDAAGNDGAVFSQAYTITPNQAPVNQLPVAQLPAGLSWTTVGAYWVYSFTQVGTSTFNLASALNVEALVVAGGAAGAWAGNMAGGGGGGGGVAHIPSLNLSSGAYSVTVGAGGSANGNGSWSYSTSDTRHNGGSSSISGNGMAVSVSGGGVGGGNGGDNGSPGGSGGGGHWSVGLGGAAVPGTATNVNGVTFYGNAGGASNKIGWGTNPAGGGGGGASSAGLAASGSLGGHGGQGVSFDITGTTVVYGSGGGGAGPAGGGVGGTNGGNATNGNTPATNGAAGTGGGGGGSGITLNGSGGSGIVVLRALTGIQVAADTPQAITGLQISDPDLTGVFTVSLTQTQGVLTVDRNVPGGLTAAGITGNETASVALTGTLAQINATLAAAKGLVLRANAGYTGPAQLTMSTSDSQGATDTDVIAIQVTADVTAPTLSSTAPTTALGAALAGTAGNSAGETITLTLTFDGNVNGLTSGNNNTIFTLAGTGVNATWAGTNGTNTRTLTYTITAGQNGQAAINEAALKTALIAGIADAAGNAFAYTANSGNIPNIDSTALPVVDTQAPTATLTAGTGTNTSNATVQSSEVGTAYLVKTGGASPVTVTSLASITGADGAKWNSVATSTASTATNLSLTGLEDGIYNLYSVDAAGNLSVAASNSYTVDSAGPVLDIQYATSATASSTFGQSPGTLWSIWQILGAPDSIFEDDGKAWAPLLANNPSGEWVEVSFSSPVYADSLVIKEIYQHGFVTRLDLVDVSGNYYKVWEGIDTTPPSGESSVDFKISFPRTNYLVSKAKVYVNSLHGSSWEQIESIGLITQAWALATSTLSGSAGNSAGETITLTLTFDGNVNGLSSGTNSTIFTVGGSGVSATWSGTGSTRTLTYTIAAGQNGQAAIDEAALKTALIAGISDAAGNAFAYSGSIPNIDASALPVIDTSAPTLSSTAPTTALGAALAGTAGNSAGETITLTLTFDGNVNGLTSGSNNTIFTVAGSAVSATWTGTNGTNTRALTYTITAGQNGQAAINEAALKTALIAGITDAAGNAFSYAGNIAGIDDGAINTPIQFGLNTSGGVDGFQNVYLIPSNGFASAVGQEVHSWSFASGSFGGSRNITPLLFEKVGNDYVLRAIGSTQQAQGSTIYQDLAFNAVAGNATIANANYIFGWKDGTQTVDNAGVISTLGGTPGSWTSQYSDGQDITAQNIGSAVAFREVFAGRNYQFNVKTRSLDQVLPVVDTKFDVAKDFIAGPTAQSANNIWQYFSADFASNNISNLQHLSNWDTDGNGLLLLAQWDGNGTSGDYPFVQKQSNGSLIIHPEHNAGKAVVVAWKNTSASSVVVDVDAALGLVGKSLNAFGSVGGQQTASSDGITYLVTTSASVGSTPVVLRQGALDESSATTTIPSSTTLDLDGLTLAPGAMVSVAVHGNAAYFWDHTQLDLKVSPIASVIDLGSLGRLIAPVQVEGKWYYHLDRNGDGTTAGDAYYRDTGTYRLSEIYDLFKQDVNGVAGTSTNDTYRYATVNGVKLALPTLGTSPNAGLMNGTALNNATQTNPSYDDLSAIWDAYNGTLVGSYSGQGLNGSNRGSGNITSGAPGAWVNDSYVSATPWPSSTDYAALRVYDGLVFNHANWPMNVALQVL